MTTRYTLDTRDKPNLLFAMMRTFASDQSRIAFEGNLATTELYRLEAASYDETEVLKRPSHRVSTLLFCPFLLTRVPEIQKTIRSKIAFGGYSGIIHVQIEADGELVFGAYDNFHRDTVVVNGTIETAVLDDLVKTQTLRSYAPVSKRLF